MNQELNLNEGVSGSFTNIYNIDKSADIISNVQISANITSIPSINATHYFYYLNNNFAVNQDGSCGYVALASILTYYDTVKNNNLVKNNYMIKSDSIYKSPGSKNSILLGDYRQEVEKTKDSILHSRLLSDGYSLGLRNDIKAPNFGEILQKYLGNNNYNYNYYIKETSNYNVLKEYAIKRILAGYPVIIGIDGSSVVNHYVVGHYTDGEDIFAHFGWSEYDTAVSINSYGYSGIFNVISIDFDTLSHAHSGNYILDSDSYCGCGKHNSHVYDYRYSVYIDRYTYMSPYHRAFCICGEGINQFHLFSDEKYCFLCGYQESDIIFMSKMYILEMEE